MTTSNIINILSFPDLLFDTIPCEILYLRPGIKEGFSDKVLEHKMFF